ncbi:MAG: hypothetical protein J6X66_10160 [Lachnospiraceae bacterium]|nr:hypothetical protein [Lachnospiraceae bacterium]
MDHDNKKADSSVVITYILLLFLAASMYLWIYMIAPWEKGPELQQVQKETTQIYVSEDKTVAGEKTATATATPTPFVKKATNGADNGCIGDEGLVW